MILFPVKTVSISFLTKHGFEITNYLKPNQWQSGTIQHGAATETKQAVFQ
jgi:hypothetical protein